VPTVTSAKTSSEISQGSSGEAVKVVQQQLIALGFLKSTATGYFGPLTLEAVIAFQKAKGIDAIGIVGPKTKAALASADVSNATPVPPTPSPTTNTNSSFIFTKRLEVGVSNSDVKELQKLLSALVFLLRARGESMINAGIYDGDLVIVRPTKEAKHNDIVVALLHDEATVKRFIQIKNRSYLKAENPDFKNIYPKEEWMIQGKVVGVIRNLE
jgi:peptidoglycan hydrolase-like protein with peptidoglycan-binding domain